MSQSSLAMSPSALINYYARSTLYKHVQNVCNDGLSRSTSSPSLLLWRAYGLAMEGSSADAMRELQGLQHHPDVGPAAMAAMVMIHEGARVVDQEALLELTARLDAEEHSVTGPAAMQLAQVLAHSGALERARSIAERELQQQQGDASVLCLLGWVIVQQQAAPKDHHDLLDDPAELSDAVSYFQQALQQQSHNIEAVLGCARALELQEQLQQAEQLLAEAAVRNPDFLPLLAERARLLVALGDWEGAMEVVAQLLHRDATNIAALTISVLNDLLREGSLQLAVQHVRELMAAVGRCEPRNARLHHQLGQLLSRLACGNQGLLEAASALSSKAMELQPSSPDLMAESAAQLLAAGDLQAASERSHATMQLDELHHGAALVALECQLAAGELQEAEQQLGFMQEMMSSALPAALAQSSALESPDMLHLRGLLAWKQQVASRGGSQGGAGSSSSTEAGAQEAASALEQVLQAHVAAAQKLPAGEQQLAALHPTRLLSMAKLVMAHLSGEPRAATEAPSPLLARCIRWLEQLSAFTGGLPQVQALLARCLLLNGDPAAAQAKAADLLQRDPQDAGAHMLACSIAMAQDKPQQALAALELAVSADFAVRDTPLYHIVQAKALLAASRLEEARRVLDAAMALPGVRKQLNPAQRQRLGRRSVEPSVSERASIYLLLAHVLQRLSSKPEAPEAKKYISDAVKEFEGTSEEVRVTVADCELAIAAGDVEGALQRLRRIPPSSQHYMKSRVAMADIYLKHRHDRAAYIKCYLDLAARTPDYDTQVMLGEALLAVQEPGQAVRAFEAALELNPRDSGLACRIGKALVATHDYQRAVDYFNKAIRNSPGNIQLQHDLAQLLIRLQQWQQAQAVLGRCLERCKGQHSGTESLTAQADTLALIAKSQLGAGDAEAYLASQGQALTLLRSLAGRVHGDLGAGSSLKSRAATICCDMAEQCQKQRKFDKSIELYTEALKHRDGLPRALLALAKLHLAAGDTAACQAQCVALLKADADNQEAAIMLAQIMFHQGDYDSALFHFQQLLERNPRHYPALAQLVQLLRWAGRPQDAKQYLEAALGNTAAAAGGSSSSSSSSSGASSSGGAAPSATSSSPAAGSAASGNSEPGYHYCMGLWCKYSCRQQETIQHLHHARRDPQWGTPAALHMAELYLDLVSGGSWEEGAEAGPDQAAINSAKALLQQVRQSEGHSLRHQVLECYATMASRAKQDVEGGLSRLLDLAGQDPNAVPVLLALARGFLLLRQSPKAKNQLKRVAKLPYRPEDGEELEAGWLLLADMHVAGGKYDLAQDLCNRCLKHNKSCARAWEQLGAIAEREQAYKDAADKYEQAWTFQGRSSGEVGYKLAFNHLKARRNVEALEVCAQVLRACPDYPKIRKDVLDKARAAIKP